MLEILTSFAVGGIAGYVIKDKLISQTQTETKSQIDLQSIYVENEKFARRNKELERENEDLLAEISKLRKQAIFKDSNSDDLEDALDSAKREVKSLRQQNETLTIKLKEYKAACESLEREVESLKNN